jgi:hypothetical protein
MFRALLTHPQEVLYKRLLVYCMSIMSVGSETATLPQPTDIIRSKHVEALILNKLNENCISFV